MLRLCTEEEEEGEEEDEEEEENEDEVKEATIGPTGQRK